MSKKTPVPVPVVLYKGGRYVPHYVSCAEVGDQLMMHYGTEARKPYEHETTSALPTEWVSGPVWEGGLRVTGYHGGRSSSCYSVEITIPGETSVTGLMSCAAFMGYIAQVSMGSVQGKWTARKQGTNYMINGF